MLMTKAAHLNCSKLDMQLCNAREELHAPMFKM